MRYSQLEKNGILAESVEKDMITYAKLDLCFNVEGTQLALNSLSKKWTDHLNKVHYEGTWTVLSLRSPGGKDTAIPDLLDETSYEDTPNMSFFPEVKNLVDSFKCPVMSVRFLNLKAGSIIKPHRDRELAFEKGEARLHFPIITNDKAEFFVEDNFLRMDTGECWYINANLIHRASNKGLTDRIHLVIDCKVNDWLKNIFEYAQKAEREEYPDPAVQRQIIESLKLQGTETAMALALQMEHELQDFLTKTSKNAS